MPRKRTEIKLIEMNKPDPTALPVRIGLNLPCMKEYRNRLRGQEVKEDVLIDVGPLGAG